MSISSSPADGFSGGVLKWLRGIFPTPLAALSREEIEVDAREQDDHPERADDQNNAPTLSRDASAGLRCGFDDLTAIAALIFGHPHISGSRMTGGPCAAGSKTMRNALLLFRIFRFFVARRRRQVPQPDRCSSASVHRTQL
ncbi:MAG: hypothetical protein WBD48_09635 [Pseudolabrys sp.]